MIVSTAKAKPFIPEKKVSGSVLVGLRFACLHCKFRLKEKDGHPTDSRIIHVSRYSTVGELREQVFHEYMGEVWGEDGILKILPFSGGKINSRGKQGIYPFSKKGVLSRNLVRNVANGNVDMYTLDELGLVQGGVTVFYIIFIWPSQNHVPVEKLLKIVKFGAFQPLKNSCRCKLYAKLPVSIVAKEDSAVLATILRTHYIFSNIKWQDTDDSVHSFIASFRRKSYKRFDYIVTEGKKGELFYVISSGYVNIVKQGKKLVTLGPMDAFGELALLGNCTRNASCIAMGPVRCHTLHVREFLRLVSLIGKQSEREKEKFNRQLVESGADDALSAVRANLVVQGNEHWHKTANDD